jgi:hypothetical protein
MVWLDAADRNTVFTDTAATTLAVNGSLVARWNDKANPSKFVLQNTSAYRPSYVVSSNSLPALNFTGTGGDTVRFDFSDISTPPMPAGTNPATYFVVVKPNLASGGQSGGFIITYGPATASTKDERYLALYGGTSNNLARFAVGAGNNIDVSTGNITQTTILTAVHSDFMCSLTANGGARGTRDVQSGNPNTGTSFYTIGDYYGGSPFYGYINEIIVFNRALPNDECQQVEGYLAWKWGVVQNLPVTHPYYYTKAPQSAFQPTNFPSCFLWVDGADQNSMTRTVSQWTDKSTALNSVTQATAGNRPTYLNNQISFGTNQGLLRENITSINTTNFTVFSTVLIRSHTNSGRIFAIGTTNDNSGDSNGFSIQLNFGGTSGLFITRANSSGQNFVDVSAANFPYNVVNTICVTITSAGAATVFVNGSSVGTFTATSLTLIPTKLAIGSSIGGATSNPLNTGSIYETIFYNTSLSDTNRQQVEGYLAWKWGTVGSLPTAHPHKNVQPFGFSPTSITGCQLWLDASDITSMTLNVTQWSDKSGNSNNLVSNASFLQPTYNGSEKSLNFPAVGFSSATVLEDTALTNTITSPSITVFGVYKRIPQVTGVTTYQRYISATATGQNDSNVVVGFNINSGISNDDIRYERSPGSLISSSVSSTSPFILSFVLNGTATASGPFAAGTQYIRQNGSQIAAGTGLSNGSAFAITRVRLGLQVSTTSVGGTDAYNGTISEVLFYTGLLNVSQVQQVEGYLAWKWGLQAELPEAHPYTLTNYFFNNTRPLMRTFIPPDLEGCQLWIDAADESTVVRSGSNVIEVKDKSGLENNVSNASSILTYTDTLNGLRTVTCPGGADNNSNSLTTSGPSGATGIARDQFNHSYFVVCKYPASNAAPTRMLTTSNDFFGHTANATVELYLEDSNSVANASTQYTFYPGTFANANAALADNSFICAGVRQNSIYTVIGNGNTSTPNTNSNGTGIGSTPGNTATTTYSIKPPTNTGANVGGQLAEVIIYNRGLPTSERQVVEGYLAWKWGFRAGTQQVQTLSNNAFPTTHPYASYPPITTAIVPSARLYSRVFNPADLSPVLWFDPQDSTSYVADANNRLTSWTSKGSNKLALTTIGATGVNGPLITKSATRVSGTTISQGTGFQFADFSSGGYFQITAAELTTTTNLRLTLTPSPHNIPASRQVTFSQLAGTVGAITLASYLPNTSYIVASVSTSTIDISVTANGSTTGTFSGVNGAVEYGNISIASAVVSTGTTLTITTSQPHGLSASPADVVTLNFTGTATFSGSATQANVVNGMYTIASAPTTTSITITLSPSRTNGNITGVTGAIIFPSTGCGLNWTGTPVTSSAGGTLVCVTHLARTPVRFSTNRNSFFSASATNGNGAGDNFTSNGQDFKLTFDNTGAAIRRNNSLLATIGNTQLTSGFNVFNATIRDTTAVTGADIITNRTGIAVKGWRYDTVLSNTDYNSISTGIPASSLSLAQIRIGGNTNATSVSTTFPINSDWYEGGLGDVFFFNRVLSLEERQLLEGWLSQKYGCNNTLGATGTNISGATGGSSVHPYRLNPTAITGQNNLDLASTTSTYAQNLVAWFDAANINSITPIGATGTAGSVVNTNRIYSWANLGGSLGTAANLIQTTSAEQPVFTTNVQNGLPGIQFIGDVNSRISATINIQQTRLSTYSTNNELTIFVVYRHTDVSTSPFILNISNASNTRVALQQAFWDINQSGGASTNTTPNFSPVNEKAYINVMRRSGNTMIRRITGNGTQSNTSTTFSNLALTGIFDQICVGHYRATDTNAPNRFKGYVHEIVIFRSALTDQAIQQVEGYLAWKWGLQASLPDTHAYYKVYT